jgi:hypothetical protein
MTGGTSLRVYKQLLNTTGSANTAAGGDALTNNTNGSYNTALGDNALFHSQTGFSNTALGAGALFNLATGGHNLAIGTKAGLNLSSGDGNIYVGHDGVSSESDTTQLGSSQSRALIAGVRGVNVGGTGVAVVISSTGQLGTLVSSARYKRDIQDIGKSSQGLYQLRPVTFRYKQDKQGQKRYGLIAEEVTRVW